MQSDGAGVSRRFLHEPLQHGRLLLIATVHSMHHDLEKADIPKRGRRCD